ncbi:MAG TPA: hypothetical protein VFO52_04720 [Longimicrobiales bacterium]|nr:hypothetical protein [Longimicrobiales bacterium]
MADMTKLPSRRLRLFLRDFRMVEAQISLAEGQSLMQYFASRKQYVNMRGARWASTNENVRFAVLRVDQVLWAAAMDNDIALTPGSAAATREIEIQLDGGLLVRAGMVIGEGQRLSDYLESQPQFLPLRNAQLLRSGRPPKEVNLNLGDVVLNQQAIQAVWEVKAQGSPAPEE